MFYEENYSTLIAIYILRPDISKVKNESLLVTV